MPKKIVLHSAIGILCGFLAWGFSATGAGELLELKGYDLLHFSRNRAGAPGEIVLVAIDEPSFAEFGKQWPWPRSLHGKLVDSLRRAGAAVIGFDILFSEPSVAAEDRAFAEAIERAGNVVLASDVNVANDSKYQRVMLIEPIPMFRDHSRTGLITIDLDRDYVVRRLPGPSEGEIPFPEQIARLYSDKTHAAPKDALIFYTAPPEGIKSVSYYQALEPEKFLPANFFKGKVVIIGRAAGTAPELQENRTDYFATPFLSLSADNRAMSGTELHANMAADFIGGTFVRRLVGLKKAMLLLLIGLISGLTQIRWRPIVSGLFGIFLAITCLFSSYFAFESYRLWVPTLTSVFPIVLSYTVFGIDAYVTSERKKREIKRAFSHYLSPSILESVLADPNNIRLGGERVEATILFSDMADFTSISEKLEPEEVSRLINRYMTAMSGIIIAHKGTIDKFIGDATMAFWGAPVADPDHALNACRAAVAMQKRLEALRTEFREEGLPEVKIRIGINTGTVIAGNMGSAELFDYTVMGDSVNLASRLEGVNKKFGTGILISRYVLEKVAGKVVVRPMGKIGVKGKTVEVEVFELIEVKTL
ncbi:MAG: CHASE2 domain-containing protein [Acidobacteriota bacterium]